MFDLKAFRKENGIKQIDVAKWLNCGQSNVSMLEKSMNLSEYQISLIKENTSIDISKYFIAKTDNKPHISSDVKPVKDRIIKFIPLVNQYAYAGYLAGYQDETYIDQLPTVPLDASIDPIGNFFAFEVKGDSMDDGSRYSYMDGDRLFCREIQSHIWCNTKLNFKDRDFVIVHKEGIVVKRIIDHDVINHKITIHSLNPFYEDRAIDLAEVHQIFIVVGFTRKTR